MTLEIQVLAWNRHNNVAAVNTVNEIIAPVMIGCYNEIHLNIEPNNNQFVVM